MRNFLKAWGPVVVVIGIGILVSVVINKYTAESYSKVSTDNAAWASAHCPALLSIGRSSRDTLITMKALPLCNQYVLENLR